MTRPFSLVELPFTDSMYRPEAAGMHGNIQGEEAAGKHDGRFGHGCAGGGQRQAQQLEPVLQDVLQLGVGVTVVIVGNRKSHKP